MSYDPFSGDLQPGEVAVLFLSQAPSSSGLNWTPCPKGIAPAVLADTSVRGTQRGKSFRFRTSRPVSAYSIYPFGGARSYVPSATLLLPVPAWKSDYVVVDAWEKTTNGGRPSTQIVAAEDGTEVAIIGSAHVEGSPDIEGAAKGQPRTWKLSRGEVIQLVQTEELTGSVSLREQERRCLGRARVPCSSHRVCPFATPSSSRSSLSQSWGNEYPGVPHLSRLAGGVPETYRTGSSARSTGRS